MASSEGAPSLLESFLIVVPFVAGFSVEAGFSAPDSGVGSTLVYSVLAMILMFRVMMRTLVFCTFFFARLSWFLLGFAAAEAMI